MKWINERVKYYSYVIYSFMYLAIFAFVGVFNLAFAQWDPAVLTTGEYWISTTVTSFTYIAAFMLTVRLATDIQMENHQEYITTEAEITKFARTNLHPDFNDFIDEVNWISKRNTWKTKMSNKLIDLNNKVRQKTLDELKTGNHSEKTKKYLKLKAQYEQELKDQWIEENLRFKKLRFPTITPSEVVTGEKQPLNNIKVVDNNVLAFSFTRRLGMLGIMIVINSLMEALFFQGSIFDVVAILMILFQLTLIMVNIFTGWVSGIDSFKRKILNSTYIRRDILVSYTNWRKTKIIDVPKEVTNETTT